MYLKPVVYLLPHVILGIIHFQASYSLWLLQQIIDQTADSEAPTYLSHAEMIKVPRGPRLLRGLDFLITSQTILIPTAFQCST